MNSEETPGTEASKETLRTRKVLVGKLTELNLTPEKIEEIMRFADAYAYTVGMLRFALGMGMMVGELTEIGKSLSENIRNMVADVKKGFEDIGKGEK